MITPIISVAQMREWENATWATGVSPREVIQRVGQLIANRLLELVRPSQRILFLAGKGHNGDDARAAFHEINSTRPSSLLNIVSPASAKADFFQLHSTQKFDLVIDGIFGIGLNRDMDADWQELIRAINSSSIPVISIDVPSGLCADTGKNFGAAITAHRTLAIGAVKAGLLNQNASGYVGLLELLSNIGLVNNQLESGSYWIEGIPNFPPPRNASTHKGTYGTCGIIAGSRGYHGAAVLAARGALRAKPGLVHLWTAAYEPVAAQLEMPMVHSWPEDTQLLENCTSLLVGPGLLKHPITETLNRLWSQSHQPLVVDASALDWLPEIKPPENAIRVLTPHPGEAARLLNCTAAQIQENRAESAKRISKKFGNCWVILKGMRTIITLADGPVYCNSSGNPGLAQGGSGDLLAGYLTGLLAQPELQRIPRETILHAVWQHGAAADYLENNRPNWTIIDLEQILGNMPAK